MFKAIHNTLCDFLLPFKAILGKTHFCHDGHIPCKNLLFYEKVNLS